nr:RecName: Full=Short cationic peptide-6d; Short=SCP-6d; AltName: Full=Short cationic peptide-6j; Short=SCP-6j; AltName: Full=Truncated variant of Cupiennin 6 family [Cupiennius salei]
INKYREWKNKKN